MTAELQRTDEAPAAPSDQFLAIIAQAARDPEVDVAKMTALLQLKERIDANHAKIAYTKAMAEMQPKLPRVRKNGTIDLGKGHPIPFAKWEQIDSIIRPILTAHGFTTSYPTRIEGGQLIMACVVSHIGGHSERSEEPVVPDSGPGRNASQARGSGRSYTKRYLTLDMLNIVTEGADDNGRASGFLTPEQANTITNLMDACELNAERKGRFLKLMNSASVEQIQQFDFERAAEILRTELRKRGAK